MEGKRIKLSARSGDLNRQEWERQFNKLPALLLADADLSRFRNEKSPGQRTFPFARISAGAVSRGILQQRASGMPLGRLPVFTAGSSTVHYLGAADVQTLTI
jgi:hypothetical protein